MTGIVDVPGVEVFGKGKAQYDLPCGYVDETGKAHRTVILRELTGEEEDMMDDDDMPSNIRMTTILSRCCEQLGSVTDKEIIRRAIGDDLNAGLPLTSSDRIAMMIYLRRVSVGDVYHFSRRCPRCGYMNTMKHLDLRNQEITFVPDDRVGKRRLEVTLPRSQKKAIVRVMTASYESRLVELRPNQKDLRSAAILARLESLDGKMLDNPRAGLAAVKALPIEDRNYLRKVYNLIEADVDTSCEITCNNKICGVDFKFPLDLGQSFFSNPVDEQVLEKELNWL